MLFPYVVTHGHLVSYYIIVYANNRLIHNIEVSSFKMIISELRQRVSTSISNIFIKNTDLNVLWASLRWAIIMPYEKFSIHNISNALEIFNLIYFIFILVEIIIKSIHLFDLNDHHIPLIGKHRVKWLRWCNIDNGITEDADIENIQIQLRAFSKDWVHYIVIRAHYLTLSQIWRSGMFFRWLTHMMSK